MDRRVPKKNKTKQGLSVLQHCLNFQVFAFVVVRANSGFFISFIMALKCAVCPEFSLSSFDYFFFGQSRRKKISPACKNLKKQHFILPVPSQKLKEEHVKVDMVCRHCHFETARILFPEKKSTNRMKEKQRSMERFS